MFSRICTYFDLFLLCLLFSCTTSSISTTKSVQQGDQASNYNDYSEAITSYLGFLEDNAKLGLYRNYERESDVCRKLAYAYSSLGQYSNALKYLDQALELDQNQNKNKVMIIEDFRLIGITHSYLGNYTQSKDFLNKSLVASKGMEKSTKTEPKRRVADTRISLAHVELALGNYSEALKQVEIALDLYNQVPGDSAGVREG